MENEWSARIVANQEHSGRLCRKQSLRKKTPYVVSGIAVLQPHSQKMALSSKESWTIVSRVAFGRKRRSLP